MNFVSRDAARFQFTAQSEHFRAVEQLIGIVLQRLLHRDERIFDRAVKSLGIAQFAEECPSSQVKLEGVELRESFPNPIRGATGFSHMGARLGNADSADRTIQWSS